MLIEAGFEFVEIGEGGSERGFLFFGVGDFSGGREAGVDVGLVDLDGFQQ